MPDLADATDVDRGRHVQAVLAHGASPTGHAAGVFWKKHSRRLWAYNYAESRFAFGWFSFKHGFQRGSYESGVYANGQPGNAFDTETMFPMGLPLEMTQIVPALWLKRLVEGGDDYRYLDDLELSVVAGSRIPDPAVEVGPVQRRPGS